MDTIINYLNNLFANLPKTEKVLAVKAEMQASMEDKYHALKAAGKSENEAIGLVISEFGNIDELVKELGLAPAATETPKRVLQRNEVDGFLAATHQAAILIGIGVFCCISAAASLILLGELVGDGLIGQSLSETARSALPIFPLFILIAAGVSLFIYSGVKLEQFKYLDQGFDIPTTIKVEIERKLDTFRPTFTLGIMIGVILCILSPLSIFIASLLSEAKTGYGVPGLLLMIAIAVYFFIYFGTIKDAYNRLLKLEDYANPVKEQTDKVIGIVAATVWPLAAATYLFLGFVFGQWGTAWIIFPILGIVFGVFAAVYSAVKSK